MVRLITWSDHLKIGQKVSEKLIVWILGVQYADGCHDIEVAYIEPLLRRPQVLPEQLLIVLTPPPKKKFKV